MVNNLTLRVDQQRTLETGDIITIDDRSFRYEGPNSRAHSVQGMQPQQSTPFRQQQQQLRQQQQQQQRSLTDIQQPRQQQPLPRTPPATITMARRLDRRMHSKSPRNPETVRKLKLWHQHYSGVKSEHEDDKRKSDGASDWPSVTSVSDLNEESPPEDLYTSMNSTDGYSLVETAAPVDELISVRTPDTHRSRNSTATIKPLEGSTAVDNKAAVETLLQSPTAIRNPQVRMEVTRIMDEISHMARVPQTASALDRASDARAGIANRPRSTTSRRRRSRTLEALRSSVVTQGAHLSDTETKAAAESLLLSGGYGSEDETSRNTVGLSPTSSYARSPTLSRQRQMDIPNATQQHVAETMTPAQFFANLPRAPNSQQHQLQPQQAQNRAQRLSENTPASITLLTSAKNTPGLRRSQSSAARSGVTPRGLSSPLKRTVSSSSSGGSVRAGLWSRQPQPTIVASTRPIVSGNPDGMHDSDEEVPTEPEPDTDEDAESNNAATNEARQKNVGGDLMAGVMRTPSPPPAHVQRSRLATQMSATRKSVRFGPALSPEVFDAKAPPSTPLRRGTPLQTARSSSILRQSSESTAHAAALPLTPHPRASYIMRQGSANMLTRPTGSLVDSLIDAGSNGSQDALEGLLQPKPTKRRLMNQYLGALATLDEASIPSGDELDEAANGFDRESAISVPLFSPTVQEALDAASTASTATATASVASAAAVDDDGDGDDENNDDDSGYTVAKPEFRSTESEQLESGPAAKLDSDSDSADMLPALLPVETPRGRRRSVRLARNARRITIDAPPTPVSNQSSPMLTVRPNCLSPAPKSMTVGRPHQAAALYGSPTVAGSRRLRNERRRTAPVGLAAGSDMLANANFSAQIAAMATALGEDMPDLSIFGQDDSSNSNSKDANGEAESGNAKEEDLEDSAARDEDNGALADVGEEDLDGALPLLGEFATLSGASQQPLGLADAMQMQLRIRNDGDGSSAEPSPVSERMQVSPLVARFAASEHCQDDASAVNGDDDASPSSPSLGARASSSELLLREQAALQARLANNGVHNDADHQNADSSTPNVVSRTMSSSSLRRHRRQTATVLESVLQGGSDAEKEEAYLDDSAGDTDDLLARRQRLRRMQERKRRRQTIAELKKRRSSWRGWVPTAGAAADSPLRPSASTSLNAVASPPRSPEPESSDAEGIASGNTRARNSRGHMAVDVPSAHVTQEARRQRPRGGSVGEKRGTSVSASKASLALLDISNSHNMYPPANWNSSSNNTDSGESPTKRRRLADYVAGTFGRGASSTTSHGLRGENGGGGGDGDEHAFPPRVVAIDADWQHIDSADIPSGPEAESNIGNSTTLPAREPELPESVDMTDGQQKRRALEETVGSGSQQVELFAASQQSVHDTEPLLSPSSLLSQRSNGSSQASLTSSQLFETRARGDADGSARSAKSSAAAPSSAPSSASAAAATEAPKTPRTRAKAAKASGGSGIPQASLERGPPMTRRRSSVVQTEKKAPGPSTSSLSAANPVSASASASGSSSVAGARPLHKQRSGIPAPPVSLAATKRKGTAAALASTPPASTRKAKSPKSATRSSKRTKKT
ncbi:hypothetical protein GGI07_004395 [Coemansia sp. Benny D115]|nr:hypothetical protein GGI07_004395 [Coemansia sp. Benny D115]